MSPDAPNLIKVAILIYLVTLELFVQLKVSRLS